MDNKAAHTLQRRVTGEVAVPMTLAVEAFRIPSRDGSARAFQTELTKAASNQHTDSHMGTITPDQKKAMVKMLDTVEALAETVTATGAPAIPAAGTHDEDVLLLLAKRIIIPALTAMGYLNAQEAPQSKEQLARRHLELYFKNAAGSETTHLTQNTLRLALAKTTPEFGGLPQDWSRGCKIKCIEGATLVRSTHPLLVDALLNGKPVPAPYNSRDPLAIKFVRSQILHWVSPAIAHSMKAQQVFGSLHSLYHVLLANDEASPLLITAEDREGDRDAKRPRHNTPHS